MRFSKCGPLLDCENRLIIQPAARPSVVAEMMQNRSHMDLLSEFAIKIYKPPFSEIRSSGRIANVSDVICIAMLVVDFETEVSMGEHRTAFLSALGQ